MKTYLTQIVTDAIQNPKIVHTVAVGTTGTGAMTALEWLPLVQGTIASLVGVILSSVLIYVNLKQHTIKMQLLKKELEDAEAS